MSTVIVALTDDLMIGTRIAGTLEAAGYVVQVVGDAATLQTVARTGAHAVLLPFAARGFDAGAIIRALRADPTTAHLPILAFGPHVDTGARAVAQAAGATRVVTNGAFFTQMPAIIASLLASDPPAASP